MDDAVSVRNSASLGCLAQSQRKIAEEVVGSNDCRCPVIHAETRETTWNRGGPVGLSTPPPYRSLVHMPEDAGH